MKNDNQAIHLIEPRSRQVGSGTVRRLLPHHSRRMDGPYIFADLIGPEPLTAEVGVDVDAHLHIGLATVTYLLAGRLVHRDSTGVVQTIEPGAVNGMTAGSGVAHTERTPPADRAQPLPRAIVLGGEPVGRRHIWWNFVHSDPARIEAAKDDWRHQRFPTVPDDHDPWVPLPD